MNINEFIGECYSSFCHDIIGTTIKRDLDKYDYILVFKINTHTYLLPELEESSFFAGVFLAGVVLAGVTLAAGFLAASSSELESAKTGIC